jgi:predicted nucleic acid-binding protein
MVIYVTLDSSVIVAALREQEEKHEECKRLLEKVKDGDFIAVESYTVLVEVVAAIKRRTGSAPLSERVKKDLQDMDTINFVILTERGIMLFLNRILTNPLNGTRPLKNCHTLYNMHSNTKSATYIGFRRFCLDPGLIMHSKDGFYVLPILIIPHVSENLLSNHRIQ